MHREDGEQDVFLFEDGTIVADGKDGQPSVLGADDASGVFLLTEMICAGVPGQYLFFVGEERGGIGSSEFVRQNPTFSADFVVSFDRRGTTDVITHQGFYETCSQKFAQALARQLNAQQPTFKYRPDDSGVYTDSREFAEIVPECTNISVGYYHEHTAKEEQDLVHLLALRDAVVKLDWGALPIDRVPAPEYAGNYNWESFLKDEWRGETIVLNRDEVSLIRNQRKYIQAQIDKYELTLDDVQGMLNTLENLV